MMNDAIEVEINLTAARDERREEGERRKENNIPYSLLPPTHKRPEWT